MWVEFVVGSPLVVKVFLWVHYGFSLLKYQHLQIPIRSGYKISVNQSRADVADVMF